MRAIRFVLVLGVCAAMLGAPASAAGNFGDELAGWWRFDEAGGTTATDSSGQGNDGALQGSAVFTSDGLVGNGVDLPVADAGVRVPYDASHEPVTGTVEVWVNVAEAKDADVFHKVSLRLVRRGVDGGHAVIGLRVTEQGGTYAYVANDDPDAPGPWTTVSAPSGSITPGRWHHLAMRWDGSELAIFVDGRREDTRSYVPVPGTGLSYSGATPFFIGFPTSWGPTPGDKELLGRIDDLRFYGRARSDVEIFTDYRSRGHRPARPPGR